jgi:hypothetical protein
MKVGIMTVDWASKWQKEDGLPALGGSGHARIGQYLPYLTCDYVIGTPIFHTRERIFGVHRVETLKWIHDPESDDLDDPHAVMLAPKQTPNIEEDCDFDCDVIFTQRNMHYRSEYHIAEARANGQIIIQDVDDDYWNLHPGNMAYTRTDPKTNPVYNRDAYRDALKMSSAVAVSTPYLRDVISEWNPRTYVLENTVEISKFRPGWDHHHGGQQRVGWVGAPEFRSGDLEVLKPFINMFHWVHGGHAPKGKTFHDGTGVRELHTLPQTIPEMYPQLFQFDVGTIPLNNIKFNEAKSWIKGLEYAAAGIPFVATNMPEYRRLRDGYGVGILVKKRADWVKHLKRLLASPDMRTELAAANLEGIAPLDVAQGAKRLQEFWEAAGS